jgi:PAS domain S-box-containing protein
MASQADADVASLRAEIDALRREVAEKDRELARVREAFDGAVEGVIRADHDGLVTYANRRMEELAGVGPGELVGRPGTELVMPTDADAVARGLARIAAGERTLFDTRIRRADEREVWLLSSVTPIMEGGALAGTLTVCLDVTERRRIEQRLVESEAKNRTLAARLDLLNQASHAFAETVTDFPRLLATIAKRTSEIVGDTCWIRMIAADGVRLENVALYDPDPTVESYLRALNDVIVQRADEGLSGRVIRSGQPELVPHADLDALRARLKPEYRAALDRVKVSSYALAPLRAHGETLGLLFMARHDEGRPYEERDLKLMVDLAERAALAIENARLYADLEERVVRRTSQLEAAVRRIDAANRELEAFSYSVSHDLRAPLRAIDGFSRIVLENHGEVIPEEGRGLLRRVIAATRRMEQLIDDLLELARLGRGELVRERVDVTDLARGIAAELAALDPAREVVWTIAEGMTAHADARLLDVVLENLIANAWKFTSGRRPAHIEVGASRHGDELAFFVRDDGAGFDMAYADKLFGAFQRLHTPSEFAGNGIGLATVKRIVERHGGSVRAEGEVGRGATFWFTVGAPPPPSTVTPLRP